MTHQIIDIVEIGIAGRMGDVTPAAIAARDDAQEYRDQAAIYRNETEILSATTQELQDGAVTALTVAPGTSTNAAVSGVSASVAAGVFAAAPRTPAPLSSIRARALTSRFVDLPAGTLQADSLLLVPWSPVPQIVRVINLGENPFRVQYGSTDRLGFSRPAVPFPGDREVAPGWEWRESNLTRFLWGISELGTQVQIIVEAGE